MTSRDREFEKALAEAKRASDALRMSVVEQISILRNLFEAVGFYWEQLTQDEQQLLEGEITDLAIHVEGDLSRTTLRADFERMLQSLPDQVRISITRDTLEFRLEMLEREEQDLAEEAAKKALPPPLRLVKNRS